MTNTLTARRYDLTDLLTLMLSLLEPIMRPLRDHWSLHKFMSLVRCRV